ncbi:MAG: hypothetical protein LBI26_03045 [Holosporales bacterium]|jgi:hypothetical protein|nr:hypothetical protein [Holosporales bacterium]
MKKISLLAVILAMFACAQASEETKSADPEAKAEVTEEAKLDTKDVDKKEKKDKKDQKDEKESVTPDAEEGGDKPTEEKKVEEK